MSTPTRPLPSWAKFMPQSNPGETTLGKEEFELRQRAFRCASKRVSNACARTLGTSIDELIALPLQRFLLQFQPQRQSEDNVNNVHVGINTSTRKRRRVQLNNVRNYIDSITYHPSILPIAIIRLSPSETDRALIVQLLKLRLLQDHCRTGVDVDLSKVEVPDEVHTTRTSAANSDPSCNDNFRPAVCVVTDRGCMQTLGKGGRGDHGDYLRDILIQVRAMFM